jgi:hypothetical protein
MSGRITSSMIAVLGSISLANRSKESANARMITRSNLSHGHNHILAWSYCGVVFS